MINNGVGYAETVSYAYFPSKFLAHFEIFHDNWLHDLHVRLLHFPTFDDSRVLVMILYTSDTCFTNVSQWT